MCHEPLNRGRQSAWAEQRLMSPWLGSWCGESRLWERWPLSPGRLLAACLPGCRRAATWARVPPCPQALLGQRLGSPSMPFSLHGFYRLAGPSGLVLTIPTHPAPIQSRVWSTHFGWTSFPWSLRDFAFRFTGRSALTNQSSGSHSCYLWTGSQWPNLDPVLVFATRESAVSLLPRKSRADLGAQKRKAQEDMNICFITSLSVSTEDYSVASCWS